MVFEKDARVQALASLFDAGTEDAKGRTYSQKRKANGLLTLTHTLTLTLTLTLTSALSPTLTLTLIPTLTLTPNP